LRLINLPYSLINSNLTAIWLAENQATGYIKLQEEVDQESQNRVLTCYLLPQQNYKPQSMENLLQASSNTEVLSVNQNDTIKDKHADFVRFAPSDSDSDEKIVKI
jgi:hypothetical protein